MRKSPGRSAKLPLELSLRGTSGLEFTQTDIEIDTIEMLFYPTYSCFPLRVAVEVINFPCVPENYICWVSYIFLQLCRPWFITRLPPTNCVLLSLWRTENMPRRLMKWSKASMNVWVDKFAASSIRTTPRRRLVDSGSIKVDSFPPWQTTFNMTLNGPQYSNPV